ncbi:MAG TPA: TlpA disulfide reductase family protein [Terriglobales bacterium]|nr:TlpA disulfide reductase family protein [Terriglobales bacterium]
MRFRLVTILLLLSSVSHADVIQTVKLALFQNDFSRANSELQTYQAQHGTDAAYLEAQSWVARAYLSANQLDQAENLAKQTESQAHQLLQRRALDAEPHLPMALGAVLEVQAQALALRGHNAQAAALLRRNLATYRTTSIRARLQKNLNMLGLAGQPAPALSTTQYLGIRPTPLSQLRGSPVLLFFWAHWCADCKQEGPVITQLNSEFAGRGLKVEAPTQLYGYAAYGEDTAPKDELAYIGRVWQHYYPGLQEVPVPVSKTNFDNYGASTTPTLVLLDRSGRVLLYHPGLMSYEELRTAIERVM